MPHLRALSALLLLIAVTGYAMEPSIDWRKLKKREREEV